MRWLRNLPLLTRTVLLVTVGLAIILTVPGFLSVRALQESTNRVLAERLRLAQLVAAHIDDHVAEALALLERAAASEGFDLTDADPEPERRALRELYATGVFAHEVFLLDRQGRVLWMEPPVPAMVGVDLTAEPEVREALETGRPQVGNLSRFHDTQKAKVSFVVPVKDEAGTVVGLIGGATEPASIPIHHPLAGGIPGSHIQVVDANGIVLDHSEGRRLLQPVKHPEAVLPLMAEEKPGIITREVIEEGKGRFSEVIAFAPSRIAPWGVLVEQPEAEALALVHHLRQRLILIGAVVFLVVIVLTWLTTQAMVVPIRQLLAATRRLAAGDLTTPVAVVGRDEVAELGRAFEAMRQRLQQREEVIAAWGEELEAAVQKRTCELSMLYAIDRVAAQSLDLEEVLNDALEATLAALQIEAGGIYLLEPQGAGEQRGRGAEEQEMVLRVHRGLSEEFVDAVRHIRLGEGISGRAAAERKPVVLDVADYPAERLAPWIVREGFQTLASTPLLSAGKPVGALSLGTRRPRAFPPEELDLLAAIGQQLGQAVANVLLHEETRRHAERLAVLNRIARALSTTLNLDELLEIVYREITAVMEADAFFIALYDDAANELDYRVRVDKGIREPAERRPLTTGLTAMIVTGRRPILIRDFEREKERLPPMKLWGTMQAPPSWLGVPMLIGGKVVGVISVQAYRPNAYGEAEQELLSTIADEVAVAIENARLYSSLQKTNVQLRAALQAKDEMIQNVSHELRTPLAIIMGFVELLQGGEFGPLTAEQERIVATLDQQGKRLHFMVHRLLTLQTLRPEALQKVPLELGPWLSETIRPWLDHAMAAKVEVRLEVAPDLSLLMADPDLLGQVVVNLLDNAIKFSPGGGMVTVRAWPEGDEVIIAVSDQGVGIPPDKLARVFERFYQVDGSMTRRFGGMGIGLALCKAIVEAHGGRIWAESAGEGRGSTFYVALLAAETR